MLDMTKTLNESVLDVSILPPDVTEFLERNAFEMKI